jgi:hypothetical protein
LNCCNVLRDDGGHNQNYLEQFTFLPLLGFIEETVDVSLKRSNTRSSVADLDDLITRRSQVRIVPPLPQKALLNPSFLLEEDLLDAAVVLHRLEREPSVAGQMQQRPWDR